jgi:flagellar basal-body rod protein FlgC
MGLFGAMDAASSGMTVSRVWLDAISDNVANVNTVRGPNEEPFRARMVRVAAVDKSDGAPGGARVTGIVERPSEPNLVYDPSHPLAGPDGFVKSANVDLGVEMTNMLIAQRSYQANLRMVTVATETYRAGLSIGRR